MQDPELPVCQFIHQFLSHIEKMNMHYQGIACTRSFNMFYTGPVMQHHLPVTVAQLCRTFSYVSWIFYAVGPCWYSYFAFSNKKLKTFLVLLTQDFITYYECMMSVKIPKCNLKANKEMKKCKNLSRLKLFLKGVK